MKQDKYGQVMNGKETYIDIAKTLINNNIIINWTDEEMTCLDLLFSYKANRVSGNYLQRGIRGNELFVSIIGFGAFGFDINANEKAPGYIAKKLERRDRYKMDMNNKISNTNFENEKRLNNFIEAYKQTKEQEFIVESINKDFFFEFVDCLLTELEQKDKRIQELEEELEKANRQLDLDYIDDNYIPKQKVKDKIEELKNEYDEILSEYGNLDTDIVINVPNKNVRKYIDELVIKILVLQELLKGESK